MPLILDFLAFSCNLDVFKVAEKFQFILNVGSEQTYNQVTRGCQTYLEFQNPSVDETANAPVFYFSSFSFDVVPFGFSYKTLDKIPSSCKTKYSLVYEGKAEIR